jgi:hypothetical protein
MENDGYPLMAAETPRVAEVLEQLRPRRGGRLPDRGPAVDRSPTEG